MSAETRRNFKQKRKTAEILNVLYYATVFPFLFHNIFKLFYYQFTRPKFVKLSSQFKEIGEKTSINKDFNLTYGGYSEDRKILQKIPPSDHISTEETEGNESKFTHTGLQKVNHIIMPLEKL